MCNEIRCKLTGLALVACLVLPFMAFAQLGGPSTGVYPQTGIYWDSRRPGEGMFVEVQGTAVGFGIFTYLEDGSQVFYTGGGQIQSLPFEEQRQTGYYPAHVVYSDLVETRGGPIFAIDGGAGIREVETESAGSVRLEFGYENSITMNVNLTGYVPPGRPRSSRRFFRQFPFGIATLGVDGIDPTDYCRPDLRGEWVFVDLSTPERPPWRFNFTELEVTPDVSSITCPSINPTGLLVVAFRDVERGAVLRCVITRSTTSIANPLPVVDPLDGRTKNACELRLAGSNDVVFWSNPSDVGLREITATLGDYPGTGHARGTARVSGFRVQ